MTIRISPMVGCGAGVLALCALAAAAQAQEVQQLQEIEVVGTTPLPGAVAPRSAVPANVQSVQGAVLREQGSTTLADHMNRNFAGVFVNEAQSNPFQPDLNYRGFVASPLLGNPIGLSVYVDGVRVNESFGDTVLWDLIPSAAIESTDLVPGSNPVFGLNTLGGALNVRTRTGRSSPGLEAQAEFGSFGRRSGTGSFGYAKDAFDVFISAEAIEEDGWRDNSPSSVRRLFGKAGYRTADSDFSLSYTHADNELHGNGLMPESLLAREPEGVYTYPDISEPRLSFLNATFTRYLGESSSLTANVYRRRLKLDTANGDAEYDDGGTPGDPTDDAYEAEFRNTATEQTTTGIGLQLATETQLAGKTHRMAVGVNLDRGDARFRQTEQDGEFTADRGVEGEGDAVLDTDIDGRTDYQSVYLTDTIALSSALDLTLSGRYTRAKVKIADNTGTEDDLNGEHSFSRFNLAIGLTAKLSPAATLYGGFNQGFRAPTPVELTCADPDDPCALPVAFVADPPLEPVIARTFEIGMRGRAASAVSWNAGFFQTSLKNDILFTSTGASQGFFANVPKTRRQGIELGARSDAGAFSWYANYAYIRATYQSDVELFNPVASENDPAQPETISVQKGDRLPGVPDHLLKAGVDWRLDSRITLGASVNLVGGQYLRGDESNNQKKLSGYSLLNLRASYRVAPAWRLFARIDNLLDEDYATLGAYNRIAFDAGGARLEGAGIGPVERFVSPGAPRAFWVGVEYRIGGK